MNNITKTIIIGLVCMLLFSTTAAAEAGTPFPDFEWTETSVTTPLTVHFTDTSYTYNERAPTSWSWDFGDNSPKSTEQNPTHVYSTTGTYHVTFTATNSAGSRTLQRDVVVLALDFSADRTSGAAPLIVEFTPHIVGIPSWNYYHLAWDFGDSNGNNIGSAHKYYNAGNYDVTLAIHSSDDRSSYVLRKPAYITVAVSPVAKFDYKATDLSVKFTDQSSNKPTSWSWNFGDNKTSADQNTTHIYEKTGTYHITLIATNAAGSDSISKDIIVVAPSPSVDFDTTPTIGIKGQKIQFNSKCSGEIASYKWDFGDGLGTSSKANPEYTYTETKTYPVTLTVNNFGGISATISHNIEVNPPAPVARIESDKVEGEVPLTVQFTDTSYNNPTSWLWDFGDGGTSTEQNPTHTFNNVGSYVVTLTVTNADGSSTTTIDTSVSAKPIIPVADFTTSKPSHRAPLAVQFIDASKEASSVSWDFNGDGVEDSTERNPSYTFETTDSYPVTLAVVSADGHTDSITKTITVAEPVNPVVADFNSKANNLTYLTYDFEDMSTGDPTEYEWNFGDGSARSNEKNPEYTYRNTGYFTVTLKVSNEGSTDTISKEIYIQFPPVTAFSFFPDGGAPPLDVQFENGCEERIGIYDWDFGDGSHSTEKNPKHTYTSAGIYAITLKGTDEATGYISTMTRDITVTKPVEPLEANFGADAIYLSAMFTDTSNGEPTTWLWDFGDGSTSTDKSPSHSYSSAGTYIIKLTISKGEMFDSVSDIITVQEKPVINFIFTPETGVAPLDVQFTDNSDPRIEAYSWDLGDGSNSTEENPKHTYASAGTYTVTLKGTHGDTGFSNIETKTITVGSAVVADFSVTLESGKEPFTVTFADKSVNADSVSWNFGDSSAVSTEKNPTHEFTAAGTYHVTLTASNAHDSKFVTKDVVVTPKVVTTAGFTVDKETGDTPLTVTFTDTSSNADTYEWNFGDSSPIETTKDAVHTYAVDGTYIVTHKAVGVDNSDVAQKVITVNKAPVIPVAAFTYTPTSGDAPLEIQFTDVSSNAVSYAWSFGIAGTSTETKPKFKFETPGTYDVTLTVTSSTGHTAFKTETITVTKAKIAPKAGFSFSPLTGDAALKVQFTDESKNAKTYSWDFNGDGVKDSTLAAPEYTYATAGTYQITQTVTSEDELTDTETKSITINEPIIPGVADFSFDPIAGNAPLTVQFTDKSTGTGVNSWHWIFGDSEGAEHESRDQSPAYTFQKAGTYIVTLYITSADGTHEVSKSITATVKPITPVADFSFDPTTGDAPKEIQFTDKSTNTVSYAWDFGSLSTSTDKDPKFEFTTPGTYPVTLAVTSATGNIATKTYDVIITKAKIAPVAGFEADRLTGDAPLTVKFTDKSQNAESVSWDFGAAGTSTEKEPTFIFQNIGTYEVTQTVTSIDGLTAEAKETIIVIVAPIIPEAAFTFSPESGDAPLKIQFTDASKNADKYAWKFVNTADNSEVGTDNVASPLFEFAAPGTYDVTLTVTSTDNHIDSETKTITVSRKPTPATTKFDVDKVSGETPLTVQFTDKSENNPTSWSWDFGDGSAIDTNQNPAHTFTDVKTYTVALTATNADGSSSTTTDIVVSAKPVEPVKADFTSIANYLSVDFTDASAGNPTGYAWGFGDGAVSDQQNPNHVYASAGTYNVKLTVTKEGTEPSIYIKDITVAPQSLMPTSGFEPNVTSGTSPLVVKFTDKSINAASYQWDFNNDGVIDSTEANPVYTFATAGKYLIKQRVVSATEQEAAMSAEITVNEAVTPVTPVVAAFSADKTSGVAALLVKFVDKSTGEPTSWNWNFGDGSENNTEKDPVHIYYEPGTYTVTLTASKEGTSNIVEKKEFVVVEDEIITPYFTANVTSGTLPLTVQFNDASTGDEINMWMWNFEDGSEGSHDKNPIHTFTKPGTYTITMSIEGDLVRDSVAKTAYITVTAPVVKPKVPVASFYGNRTSGTAPMAVKFTDKSTNIPTKWLWNFGDGITSSIQNPTHTYNKAGKYTMTLTASNVVGKNVATRTNYIIISAPLKAPIAAFSASPTSGNVPLKVAFTDSSTSSPTSWKWSFGDGASSTEKNPVYTYSKAGKYTVILTTTNKVGSNTATKSSYIVVNVLKVPVAAFSASSIFGKEPLKVQFTDKSTNSPTSWKWSFGDGTYSTSKSPSHTYSKAGKYTVSLTSKNSAGGNTKTISGYVVVSKK